MDLQIVKTNHPLRSCMSLKTLMQGMLCDPASRLLYLINQISFGFVFMYFSSIDHWYTPYFNANTNQAVTSILEQMLLTG